MRSYDVISPSAAQREEILVCLPQIAALGPELREQALSAWATVIAASSFDTLAQVPFSHGSDETLVAHTSDVIAAGQALGQVARDRWQWVIDDEKLLAVLLLHDLDKPLLMSREGGRDMDTAVSKRIPHGVLGALILNELGVDEDIIAAVATHATHAPLRGPDREVLILHYADLFAADKMLLATDRVPFFQRRM